MESWKHGSFFLSSMQCKAKLSSSFQCIIIIAAFILFCLCKITIVNVISSYMLVKTPSGELLVVAYMPYVIQKYVLKKEQRTSVFVLEGMWWNKAKLGHGLRVTYVYTIHVATGIFGLNSCRNVVCIHTDYNTGLHVCPNDVIAGLDQSQIISLVCGLDNSENFFPLPLKRLAAYKWW